MGQARHLTWDGCVNVRDLGGLPTEDGAETRYGAVVRADNLSTLSEKGRREMLAYGVKRVIDLRWLNERNEDPQVELGVEVVHLPLFGDHNERHDVDRQLLERIPDHADCRRVMYLEHMDQYGERFAAAVAAVASAPEGCVVVHCAGGVDRTGLVAALLLRLAQVSIDDVATDFGLSRDSWAPHAPEWIEETDDEREREFRRFLAAMPAESMLGVLEEVDDRYGGAESYLRASGVADADMHRIRATARVSVLAVFGPTASGKTAVAEAIAERIPAELVSADSMQVYQGLPILTAQPARPTRLVAVWELGHEASVVEYQALAHRAVDEALADGRTPVVVGGTGLYLRAALSDLSPPPPGARERWERLYDHLGPERAHGLLAERDPPAAMHVHPNDRRRVVRALELVDIGESLRPSRDALWSAKTRHPTLVFGLEVPREELERRIATRTQAMFDAGVEDEVERALTAGVSYTARHALGLDEIARLPREEAIAAVVLRTRRYAAYQRKWMRKMPDLIRVEAARLADEVADEILEVARARERLPAH